jgi:hypothetical protein
VVPIGYLVFEQVPATKPLAVQIGPYYSGIATYVLVALAMVIGSLLKPGDSRETRGAALKDRL